MRKNLTWRKTVEDALGSLGGVSNLKAIYEAVQDIREENGLSTPKSLKAVVRKELEYNSSDSSNWKGSEDLFYSVHGIGKGIWGLRAELPKPQVAFDIVAPPEQGEHSSRVELTVSRIVRDTSLARKLKAMHGNACQICGLSIKLPDGSGYVEAHHVVPLGKPHNGADAPENIVVVCPNHHAMLDLGCIALSRSGLSAVNGHQVAQSSLDYHNNHIFEQRPD